MTTATLQLGRSTLVCCVCGHGVVVTVPPTGCPMCQGSSWQLVRNHDLGGRRP
jgi:rubrerythrin